MNGWVGQTLGKVHIDALLAKGGMAEVYIGTHTTLQREVAVKVLRNNYDEHPHALERFQREAMVVGKLRHPNIVQVFDFDMVESHPYLVMEYIKGPSLLKYLNSLHEKDRLLDFPHVIRLMNAMTSALQYAHDSGVIHRDIKPGNILLTSRSSDVVLGRPLPDDFEPVLTDFGLVRFIDSTVHTTGSGQIAGTPAYMSPEQARGEITDGRTDIYSLGIVLYEILAGHLPFEGETTMGVLMKHINEPPSPVPGLPKAMQNVLDRALAKDVDDRFQTPEEFGEAFIQAVENKADFSTLDVLSPKPTRKRAKRLFNNRKSSWLRPALVAFVVFAVAGALLFNRVLPMATETGTPSSTITWTVPPPTGTTTSTQTPQPTVLLGRTGVLQFQNASSTADQAALIAVALLAPPADSRYEVWLFNEEERISLGLLTLDGTGRGELTYTADDAENLIALYKGVELTIEPDPDTNPQASGIVAYSFSLEEQGLIHLRYLLASFPNAPGQHALVQGLYDNVQTIDELAKEMQNASESGSGARVRLNAEAILNIITGDQSPNYKDWNGDGQVDDPSDGYGLLLNGRNLGYLQAVYMEAEAVVNSTGASRQMITYGEGLKISVQNLALWTGQLQELLTAILSAAPESDISQKVIEAAGLTERMLNGIDLDEDGIIEPVNGEAGAQVGFEQAYRMADMPLVAVGILNIGTGTPTFVFSTSTPERGNDGGSGGGGGSGGTVATEHVPPGQVRTPPGQEDKTRRPPGNDNNTNNSSNNDNPNRNND
ncbi:MAG TPA: serine/threonine-protein kinase [Anaerolineales bacterium]|nr:serine/threonine-protein kinase [Anaerolineales bacterium]